ncbi:ATP-binding cassette subfamily B protein/subfamily B ATP-binding cassette protein MsbA [Alkalibacillus filiformis]|uniref:ATP-binding cassette subfamily B protein/subfamily B ATP-binding cassette protein MsbA n=1 Tax=Alkalibacillus filiformis TaxID=200990 RepID=A0ABU0DQ51_9BACI|nr:ABC transporter ATP-binding protein [Alkalibacillus filiformis]MDQ0350443.1 ATP-binding cassette subfamily B protein/subfamily B ATP-binding cassette protein MsbA [Alkalibacillus filiformis]
MDIFKKLKKYYWPYKRFLIFSLISMLFVTVITAAYPVVLQLTIDEVIYPGNFELIPMIVIAFIVLMGIKALTVYTQQYLGDLFGISTVYKVRDDLYKKLQRLSFKYYDNAKTGDLMSRLTADVEGFRFFLSFGFAEMLRVFSMVTVSLAVMLYYSVPLALVTIAVMPFLAVSVYMFDKRVHPAFLGIRRSFGRMNTRVQENISGMNTVKSLSREDFEIGRYEDKGENYRDHYIKTAKIWAKYMPFMEFVGNVSVVALLAYGGYLVMQGSLQPGELAAFFSLVWMFLGPLMNFGFVVNMFSQAKASGERLLEVLESDLELDDQIEPKGESIKGHVTFNNVTLTYVEDDDEALKDISFDAPPGKVVGLIGATGSGKSSITQLMTRFYEPEQGEVLIDGKPTTEYSLKDLRKHIGFVLQEPFLFSTTIKENISYGNPEASMDDIIDAAKSAQAHDFIMEMPNGYDTLLGERGMGLSGGQKQRISIARALLINPSILVLDDATSAVDMQTEFKIQSALKEVMHDRTTFIIAHRISSLKHADEILVLEDGEIVERGKHDYLLQNNGPYQRIYDIQYQDKEAILGKQHV